MVLEEARLNRDRAEIVGSVRTRHGNTRREKRVSYQAALRAVSEIRALWMEFRIGKAASYKGAFNVRQEGADPMLRSSLLIAVVLGAVLTTASCRFSGVAPTPKEKAMGSLATSPTSDDSTLVIVNGRRISRADFVTRVVAKAGKFSLQRQILDDELIRQEADKRSIAVSDADASEAAAKFLEGLVEERGGRKAFEDGLQAFGVTMREFAADLLPQVRSELLRVRVVQAARHLTDDALREAYQKTYKKKRYMARHIAFSFETKPGESESDKERRRLEAFSNAKRATDRVRDGHDFSEIARAESDDPVTKRSGGKLPAIVEDDPWMPARVQGGHLLARRERGLRPSGESAQPGLSHISIDECDPEREFCRLCR